MFWVMDSARAANALVVLTKSAKKKAKPIVATKAGGPPRGAHRQDRDVLDDRFGKSFGTEMFQSSARPAEALS